MLTCLGLTYFSSRPDTKSVMEKVKAEDKQGPVIPDAKPVQGMPSAAKSNPSAGNPTAAPPAASDQAAPAAGTGQPASPPANPAQAPANPSAPTEKSK
jgi:hypothetical protein